MPQWIHALHVHKSKRKIVWKSIGNDHVRAGRLGSAEGIAREGYSGSVVQPKIPAYHSHQFAICVDVPRDHSLQADHARDLVQVFAKTVLRALRTPPSAFMFSVQLGNHPDVKYAESQSRAAAKPCSIVRVQATDAHHEIRFENVPVCVNRGAKSGYSNL